MKRTISILALLFSFLTLAYGSGDGVVISPVNSSKLHMSTTPQSIIFDEYKGRVVFVEVFAERCPHCINAIPIYNNLYNKFPKKLGIITIEAGGLDDQNLKDFIELHEIEYPTATQESAAKLLDLAIKRGKSPGWVPFLLILDKSGKIATTKIGPTTQAELEKIVLELSK